MIIDKIHGNLDNTDIQEKNVDYFNIEWYEAGKKILRKKTEKGEDISLKMLKEGSRLRDGDILRIGIHDAVVVNVLPCEAIKIIPESILKMGSLCYEIGNKHLPIFLQDDAVLIPYEDPIFRWLQAMEYDPEKVTTKLLTILNSTVQPHSHSGGLGTSILAKIITRSAK